MDKTENLNFILQKTNCNNLNELSKKTKIHYQNLYRVFVKNQGNLQTPALRKIIEISNNQLKINHLYDINI